MPSSLFMRGGVRTTELVPFRIPTSLFLIRGSRMKRNTPSTMTTVLGAQDRKIGLFFLCVIEALFGCGCILAAFIIAFPPFFEQLAKAPDRSMSIMAMLPLNAILYFLLGAAFIWLFVSHINDLRRLPVVPTRKSSVTLQFCDQGIDLKIFGVIQIVIGCVCCWMAIFTSPALEQLIHAPHLKMKYQDLLPPATIFFLILTIVWIWLGIGLICARRWAWNLTVVLMWMWLIAGIIAVAAEALFWQTTADWIGAYHGKISDDDIRVIQIQHALLVPTIYILLPTVFLIFFHRVQVRATVHWRDMRVRWTDRCPMPVLALSTMLVSSVLWISWLVAFYCLRIPLVDAPPSSYQLFEILRAYHHVLSFGGVLNTIPGMLIFIFIMLISVSLAWGTYRLIIAAWWGTLLYWAACILFLFWTFSRIQMSFLHTELFDRILLRDHIGHIDLDALSIPWIWLFFIAASMALCYLIFSLRYFLSGNIANNSLWSVAFDCGKECGSNVLKL